MDALEMAAQIVYKTHMPDDLSQKMLTRLCALRLRSARRMAGHAKASIAIAACKWPRRAYYAHEAGTRIAEQDTRRRYAAAYRVGEGWLAGEGELTEAEINHLNQNDKAEYVKFDLPPSQSVRFERIPLLTGSGIIRFILADDKGLRAMLGQDVPVPAGFDLGERSFVFEIPGDDTSMTGSGGISFPPGALVIVDPSARIMPGNYVLAMLDYTGGDSGHLVLRRYQAARPYTGGGMPCKLIALNPDFEPIAVDAGDACRIIGRAVYTFQRT